MDIIIEFSVFKLILVPNFSLNWQFYFFLTRFTQKAFFWSKTEVNITYFCIILHIQISLVRNFSSNWQFWFLGSNLPKKLFPVENRKREHHHGILHIWISLVQNFSLNWLFWVFGPNLRKKGIFGRKQNKHSKDYKPLLFYVVKVNSTVLFKNFEDLKDLSIFNILKEILVMSCLLGSFYLNIV